MDVDFEGAGADAAERKRLLEVDLEREAGGAGRYDIDLNKFKLLTDEEWNNVRRLSGLALFLLSRP